MMNKPTTDNAYFLKYISLVKEDNIHDGFTNQEDTLQNFYNKIDEEKSLYAYAEGKWTLKEMLQHLIDTERVFSYRALCIARKEQATLPGFDENDYSNNSKANTRSWASLVEEMQILRMSTQMMFDSFTNDMLENEGSFSSAKDTVNTLGYIMAGHIYHHVKVAEERYF
jgi:DinB superfamily